MPLFLCNNKLIETGPTCYEFIVLQKKVKGRNCSFDSLLQFCNNSESLEESQQVSQNSQHKMKVNLHYYYYLISRESFINWFTSQMPTKMDLGQG